MKWLMCLIMTFALWMLLFWSLQPSVIVVGGMFALLVSVLLGRIYPDNLQKILNPARWLFFLIYVPYFFYYCMKANLDVAVRIIHPDVPIRPGIVKVATTLKTDLAKTFLANSITLTPGTLTVDVIGQDFYVHWINIASDDAAEQTRVIVERFEGILARVFE